MKSKLRLRVLLPVALLALMGVGFGAFAFTGTPGGDEAAVPVIAPKNPAKNAVAAPAKRKAWAKKANAICSDLNADAAALGTPQSRNDMLALLPQSLALADAALADLRELPPPRGDRRRVKRMLAFFERFISLERKSLDALSAGDVEGFARLTARAFAANDRGNRITRSLGARACAEGGRDDTELARALERNRVVVAVLYAPDSDVDRIAIREARAGARLAGAGFVAIDVYDAKEIAPVAAQYAVRGAPSVLVLARARGPVNQFGGFVDRETVAQSADNASV